MLFVLLFFLQIISLHFLSRKLTGRLYKFIYSVTKSKKWTVYLFAVLFLPGTFIHEVSHYLAALFLFVPAGKLKIMPEVEDEKIKLGSVSIGKTDPFRKFIVGIAPLLFGNLIIYGLLKYGISKSLLRSPYYILLTAYCIFQIGNTMFLSKEDLKGAWKLLGLLAFFYFLFNILGLRISVDPESFLISEFIKLVQTANIFLLVPIVIDLTIITFFKK